MNLSPTGVQYLRDALEYESERSEHDADVMVRPESSALVHMAEWCITKLREDDPKHFQLLFGVNARGRK